MKQNRRIWIGLLLAATCSRAGLALDRMPKDATLDERLKKKVSINFRDVPLPVALEQLAKILDCPMAFDLKFVTPEKRVTVQIRQVEGVHAIKAVALPHKLTSEIYFGVVYLTDWDQQEAHEQYLVKKHFFRRFVPADTLRKLLTPIRADFTEASLQTVIDSLARQTHVNFLIDPRAARDAPKVTFLGRSVRGLDCLELIMSLTGLDSRVEDDGVWIQNRPEKAE